jgi:hypothetical protein
MKQIWFLTATFVLSVTALQANSQTSAKFPRGTYIYSEGSDARAVTRQAGVEIEFGDGVYLIRRDGEPRVEGRYSVNERRVTFTDIGGVWACMNAESQSATYVWELQGKELSLKVDGEDKCQRRRNRLADAKLIRGSAPSPLKAVPVPGELQSSWQKFWNGSDDPQWADRVFMPDAVAEDGGRTFRGLEEIKGRWLAGQNAQSPQASPFEFSRSGNQIIEKGSYRITFTSPSARLLVGRYEITWILTSESMWKVQKWILR